VGFVFSDRLFPAKELYDWLSYGDPKYFANREISYAIRVEGGDGKDDEAIIRFLSYDDFAAFKKDIKIKLPLKMDIGAVYNSRPINRAVRAPPFLAFACVLEHPANKFVSICSPMETLHQSKRS
jgi:hypothetical protein